ncbi:hypothetical protein [Mangrovicella endophytica]|uniref:hypothetical protein n=1 Tax=Mangrovicella endophytica TaxID=2066697 RepID=UPI000C9E0D08|nr:hypothetical protein [Mangrovicella endophytica]
MIQHQDYVRYRPVLLPDSFILGAVAQIVPGGLRAIELTDAAEKQAKIVYVMADDVGAVLRVGQTGRTFAERWSTPLSWLDLDSVRRPIRPNEIKDMETIRKNLRGRLLTVWIKTAEEHSLSYLGEVHPVSLRHSEEIYLDRVLKPVIGQPLSIRD